MLLRPQDFLVALKLAVREDQRWTYALLAQQLGLSASEVHSAVKRGLQSGLLAQNLKVAPATLGNTLSRVMEKIDHQEGEAIKQTKRRARMTFANVGKLDSSDNPVVAHKRNLAEFAVYGAKYALIAERSATTVGIPTSHSAPAFEGVFAKSEIDFVWPHPEGHVRGVGISPIHPCVPFAVMQDAKLYEVLALFDALRVGRARERGMALKRLPLLIYPDTVTPVERPMRG
jgi:hypothetical protein